MSSSGTSVTALAIADMRDVSRDAGAEFVVMFLHTLMRRFCAVRGIPFLDTTDALQARFLSGENVYFPDESHLNERGHAVVADALARYLRHHADSKD